jgi:hypothetical protein
MLPADPFARRSAAEAEALFRRARARALPALPGRLAVSPEALSKALGLELAEVSAADYARAEDAARAIRSAAGKTRENTLLVIGEADLFDGFPQATEVSDAVREALRRSKGCVLIGTLASADRFAAAGALPVSADETRRLTSFAAEEVRQGFGKAIEEAAARRGLGAVLAAERIKECCAANGRLDAALFRAWLAGEKPPFLRVLAHPALVSRLLSLRNPGRLVLGGRLQPSSDEERFAAAALASAGLLSEEGTIDINSRSNLYFIPNEGASALFSEVLCDALTNRRRWRSAVQSAAEALYKADAPGLSQALSDYYAALTPAHGDDDRADAAAMGFAATGLAPSPLSDARGFAVRLPGGLREIAFVRSAAEARAMRPGPKAAARLAVLLSE